MSFKRLVVLILVSIPLINGCKPITILSDFTNNNDIKFFKQTLPWIVDNIGSDIRIFYHFKDSGKDSGPRKCVLSQLATNPYLQATYLRCEANGKGLSECIKLLPLNIRSLNACIRFRVKGFVKQADREFQRYKIATTPALVLPRKHIVSNKEPEDILKEICTLYPRNKPTGCIKPSLLPTEKPNTENKTITEKPSTDKNKLDTNANAAKEKEIEIEKDKENEKEKENEKSTSTELPNKQADKQEKQEKDSSNKNESSETNQKETSEKGESLKENTTPAPGTSKDVKSDNSQNSNGNPKEDNN